MRPLLLLLFLAPAAVAQPRAVPLDQALALARDRALDVLRADAAVAQAQIATDAVADRRLPSLSLALGGGQRYGLGFDQTSGGLTQSRVESMDVGLDVGYTLFDGFARRADGRAAQATLRAAELDRTRARQAAATAVLQGYLAIAQARAAAAVAAQDVATQRELLDAVAVQAEVGERPGYEVAQQRERVATAQAGVLAAERDQALAEARLVRVLGLDGGDYTFPTDSAEPAPANAGGPPPSVDAEALVDRALAARPDLAAAQAAVQAAEADRQAARAGRLPTVTVGAYLGTGFSSAAQAALVGQLGDNRAGALRLNVSVPLLDRGAVRQRVRQAEARATFLERDREDARRGVALEVRERAIALDALDAQSALADVRVEAAQAALAAERARFDAGEATLQAVSILLTRLVEAEAERARLAVEARFERLFLAVAVGDDPDAWR